MSTCLETKRDERLGYLLELALTELHARGSLDVAGWQRRHPEEADELSELLDVMQALDVALGDCLPGQ